MDRGASGWVPARACGLHGFDGSRAAKVLPGMSNLCKGTGAAMEWPLERGRIADLAYRTAELHVRWLTSLS
jgi:hypothetical protein